MAKTIMLSAGEASGDLHGAHIAQRLQAANPANKLVGMGSQQMQAAGVELLIDSRSIAVMGLIEVLAHWGEIQAALKTLKAYLHSNPPDLLVLIDYQEFNLKLAKEAKQLGIKVLFYVSPQVWAWRSGRAKKIGKAIDMMAVIFPFETKVYQDANVPVRYVGHPLVNKVNPSLSPDEALSYFGLTNDRPIIGLMPGSRKSEIKYILPIVLASAQQIQQRLKNVQFILPVASTLGKQSIQEAVENSGLDIILSEDKTYDAIACCQSIIAASGTATLEIALLGIPMCIVYHVSGLSYAILSRLIEIEHVGLPNIIAARQVVPEYIQGAAQAEDIANEIIRQINDDSYRQKICSDLAGVKQALGTQSGIEGIGQLILEMLAD